MQSETDIAYNRGFRDGYDRISRQSISDANQALERAGVERSGSLADRITYLADERDRFVDLARQLADIMRKHCAAVSTGGNHDQD